MTVFGNNDFSIGYEKKGLDEGSIILTVDGERYSGYEQQFPLFLKIEYNQSFQKLTTVQNRATEKASSPPTGLVEVP